jgi:hypothetical protein
MQAHSCHKALARQEEVGQRGRHECAVGPLSQAAVAALVEALQPLDDCEDVFGPSAQMGLSTVDHALERFCAAPRFRSTSSIPAGQQVLVRMKVAGRRLPQPPVGSDASAICVNMP